MEMADVTPIIAELQRTGRYMEIGGGVRATPAAIDDVAARLEAWLSRYHRLHPDEPGRKVDAVTDYRRLLDRAAQEGRGDDTAAVIRHRLDVFTRATSPLIAYYRDRGILLEVDADQPPEAVTSDILTRLADRLPIRDTT